MKKKWILLTLCMLIVVTVGVWVVRQWIAERIYSEIAQTLETVDVDQEIEKLTKDVQNRDIHNLMDQGEKASGTQSAELPHPEGSPTSPPKGYGSAGIPQTAQQIDNHSTAGQSEPGKTASNKGSTPSGSLQFESRADAIAYAKQRFSAQEIVHYTKQYANRSQLTAEEKKRIKSEILSRFTAEELKALAAAANK